MDHDEHPRDPEQPEQPEAEHAGTDDAIERLRAADPAVGVEARAGFADEVVARASGPEATASGAAGSGHEEDEPDLSEPTGSTPVAPVADLDAARARRRRTWVAAASVAAALALVG
ncbi:hypothetical protein, partial [Agromyces seonyuensis]|nr:hypothetical protein [Agromyces seonyuensis]